MLVLLWYFVTIIGIGAAQESVSYVSNEQAAFVGDSELTKAFRTIFLKALEPKGTYYRDLLIATGIVPPPANQMIPRDERSDLPSEMNISEKVFEHFKKHIDDILASDEKLSLVIDHIFSRSTIADKKSNPRKKLHFSTPTVDFKMTTEELEELATSNTLCTDNPDSVCPGRPNTVTVNPDVDSTVDIRTTFDAESEDISPSESSSESVSGTTSDYMKFLTDGLASSASSSVEETEPAEVDWVDQVSSSVPSLTDGYIGFLRSESTQYPTERPSTKTVESEIEGRLSFDDDAVEIETDLSESTQYVPILTSDYIKFLQTEHIFQPSIENPFSETIDIKIPIDELHATDNIDTESESTYFNPESEPSTTYSPYTDELVSISTVTLDEEPSFSTTEALKYLLSSLSQTSSTESSDFVTENQTKPSARRGRKNIVLGDTGGPLGQIFPNLPDIPDTNFTCDDKKHIPGFYADNETSCQVFHVCWPGRRESFLCPWGTTFNQAILACDYWDESVCAETVAHYDVNSAFKESLTGAAEPMDENLLQLYQGNQKIKPKIITEDEYITELLEADVHFAETVEKHNLTTIWKKNLLPIRAKIYEKPHPDFSKYIFKHQSKSKRSKDDGDATSTDVSESDHSVSEGSISKKRRIESIILNVLKKLSAEKSASIQ